MGIGMGNGLLVFSLLLLLSTAGASVLYYTVESRFREIGRRISRSWSGKQAHRSVPIWPQSRRWMASIWPAITEIHQWGLTTANRKQTCSCNHELG